MQTNTVEENYFHESDFNHYPRDQLVDVLGRWLKQQRKNKKEPSWNSLLYCLGQLMMPDVAMSQLLVGHQFFLEKISCLLSLCKFKTQTFFNGVEIRLGETFVAFDTQCKLQKVTMQVQQIKSVTQIQSFAPISRSEMTSSDRKQRIFIYNRQKSRPTTFLTIQLKSLERTKHELFKEDHLNKMKFFTNFVFGEHCPSFCASGINMIKVRENEWLKEKVNLDADNIYLICEGTFMCFLQNISETTRKEDNKQNDSVKQIQSSPRFMLSSKKSKQNNHTISNQNPAIVSDFINKIELNKGSIIQSSSFQEILTKLGQQSIHKFQSCKAISDSVIFEIKSSEFYRAINLDKRCKYYFLTQYQKVLYSRKLLFSQSISTLHNFFHRKEQFSTQNELTFSISRRKSSKGFRTERSSNRRSQDMQTFTTVQIYETMIKNKQKVLCLQRQYESKKNSPAQKNIRYEDNKKLKENYKRMKIKDFQIQKMMFSNSAINIKDQNGFKSVKSRFGQVKGIFEDQIEYDVKIIRQQRKTMFQADTNKENHTHKRKGSRQKSYSPETNIPSYFKQSLACSRTCLNSPRVSLNQDLFQEIKEENSQNTLTVSENQIHSRQKIKYGKKMSSNLPSAFEIAGGGESKKSLFGLVNGGNKNQMSNNRMGRKNRTFLKRQTKRESYLPIDFQPKMTVTSFVKLV